MLGWEGHTQLEAVDGPAGQAELESPGPSRGKWKLFPHPS